MHLATLKFKSQELLDECLGSIEEEMPKVDSGDKKLK